MKKKAESSSFHLLRLRHLAVGSVRRDSDLDATDIDFVRSMACGGWLMVIGCMEKNRVKSVEYKRRGGGGAVYINDERVPTELKKAIMQARGEKKLTQSQLAQLINEKPQVIQEYESGKAIPNQQILSKLERALGAKLRGKK
ncbi:hypothetical protein F2Q70_00041115 [Brassica cretica]|uniref:HTH cro/C1-type domain-containing protein n=1 Tax=Brassica cretica TaxID=69181 RepID=A0A8S9K3D9_BRACR|nr:hypothetical protein F2Q70_00041115 [Brassica cretica]